MRISTAIFLNESELREIIAAHLATLNYQVEAVSFELEHKNGSYSIGGARVMANPMMREE